VLLVVGLVVAASAIEIGRPALHNKLNKRKAMLGESVAASVQAEQLAHLRVAAAERESSLADKVAADLEEHVAAKEAEKASMIVDSADEETAAETEAESGAGAADTAATANANAHAMMEALAALEYKLPKRLLAPKGSKAKVLVTKKTKWSSCLANADKAVGVTTLKAVGFKSAPPLRDQSFVVNIDGDYKGPNVEYGSVTLQIAREEKDELYLVYRHSIVLSDVLHHAFPFRAGDPFTTSMYVPSDAFNLMAKEGDHVLTVVFTNQAKQPFACAKLEFNLA